MVPMTGVAGAVVVSATSPTIAPVWGLASATVAVPAASRYSEDIVVGIVTPEAQRDFVEAQARISFTVDVTWDGGGLIGVPELAAVVSQNVDRPIIPSGPI